MNRARTIANASAPATMISNENSRDSGARAAARFPVGGEMTDDQIS
jgi:hypothetical protein